MVSTEQLVYQQKCLPLCLLWEDSLDGLPNGKKWLKMENLSVDLDKYMSEKMSASTSISQKDNLKPRLARLFLFKGRTNFVS